MTLDRPQAHVLPATFDRDIPSWRAAVFAVNGMIVGAIVSIGLALGALLLSDLSWVVDGTVVTGVPRGMEVNRPLGISSLPGAMSTRSAAAVCSIEPLSKPEGSPTQVRIRSRPTRDHYSAWKDEFSQCVMVAVERRHASVLTQGDSVTFRVVNAGRNNSNVVAHGIVAKVLPYVEMPGTNLRIGLVPEPPIVLVAVRPTVAVTVVTRLIPSVVVAQIRTHVRPGTRGSVGRLNTYLRAAATQLTAETWPPQRD